MTTPDWVHDLADHASAAITGYDMIAPMGCHWHHNATVDQWEVTIFVAATEVLGGPLDGQKSWSPFSLDLQSLQQAFATIESFHWQSLQLGPDDDLGPHVSIEGTFGGHRVWLRVAAKASNRFGVGRVIDSQSASIEDLW